MVRIRPMVGSFPPPGELQLFIIVPKAGEEKDAGFAVGIYRFGPFGHKDHGQCL